MSRRSEVFALELGILLVLGMHVAAIAILWIIGYIASLFVNPSVFLGQVVAAAIFFISIFQLLYVIPVVFLLRRRQRWRLMKGVIIGAVITALLNGGCWLFVITQFR